MSFCKNCGHESNKKQTFCTNCGVTFEQKQETSISEESKQAKQISFFSTKRSKIGVIIALVLIAGLFTGYKIVKFMNRPSKLVESFVTAIKNDDAGKVSSILSNKEHDVEIDEAAAKQFITYLKDHPDLHSDVKKDLEAQARLEEGNSMISKNFSDLLTLKEGGKKWFIFDQYGILAKPLYIKVTANQDPTTIFIDGKKMGTVKADEDVSTFGPYLPIEHKVKAVYKGEYDTVENEQTLNPSDADEDDLYADFDLTGNHVYVYSNYDDAMLFVNGKNINKTVGEVETFGPVKTDGSIRLHAEIKDSSGIKKSNTVAIQEAAQEVELYFEEEYGDIEYYDETDPSDIEVDYEDESTTIQDVIAAHYNQISNGNYSEAYDLFSSNRKGKFGYEKWAQGLKANYRNDVQYVNVESIDGYEATASFKMTSYDQQADGTSLVQEWGGKWHLVKENDGWKLATPEIKNLGSRTE